MHMTLIQVVLEIFYYIIHAKRKRIEKIKDILTHY
jgi:hypothetical protein